MSEVMSAPNYDLLKAMGCGDTELEKAYGRKDLSKLIPIQKQVRGKHGTHIQTVWVKPEDAPKGDKPKQKKPEEELKPAPRKKEPEEAPVEAKMNNPFTMTYSKPTRAALQDSFIGSRRTAKDLGYKEQLDEKNLVQSLCIALEAQGKSGKLNSYQLKSKTGSGQNFTVQVTYKDTEGSDHTMDVVVPVKACAPGVEPDKKKVAAAATAKPQSFEVTLPKPGTNAIDLEVSVYDIAKWLENDDYPTIGKNRDDDFLRAVLKELPKTTGQEPCELTTLVRQKVTDAGNHVIVRAIGQSKSGKEHFDEIVYVEFKPENGFSQQSLKAYYGENYGKSPDQIPAEPSPWGVPSAKELDLPKGTAAKGFDLLSEAGQRETELHQFPGLFNAVSDQWTKAHSSLNDGDDMGWHSMVSRVVPLEIEELPQEEGKTDTRMRVKYRAQIWTQDNYSTTFKGKNMVPGETCGYVPVEGTIELDVPRAYTKTGEAASKAEEDDFNEALRAAAEQAKKDGMAAVTKRNEAMAAMQFDDEPMWQAIVTTSDGKTYKILFPQDENQAKAVRPRKRQIQDALKKFMPNYEDATVGTTFNHVSKKVAIYEGEADNIDPETGEIRSRNYMNALKAKAASDSAFKVFRQRVYDYAAAASQDGMTVVPARTDWEHLEASNNWHIAKETALNPSKEDYTLSYGGYTADSHVYGWANTPGYYDESAKTERGTSMHILKDYPYTGRYAQDKATIDGVDVHVSVTDSIASPTFATIEESSAWMRHTVDNLHVPNTGDTIADGVIIRFTNSLLRAADDPASYGEAPTTEKFSGRTHDFKLPYGMADTGKYSVEMYEVYGQRGNAAPTPPKSVATEKAIKKWAKDHGFSVTFVNKNTGTPYRHGGENTADHKARFAVFHSDSTLRYAEASHTLERVKGGIKGAQDFITSTQKELSEHGLTLDSSFGEIEQVAAKYTKEGTHKDFNPYGVYRKASEAKVFQQSLADYSEGKQVLSQAYSGLNKGKSASKPAPASGTQQQQPKAEAPKAEAPKAEPATTSTAASGGIAFPSMGAAEAKSHMKSLTASHSRDDIMSAATAAGISWNKHENPAVNWMRASMAIQKQMTGGVGGTTAPKQPKNTTPKQPKAESAATSTTSGGGSGGGKIEFAVPDGTTSKAYIQNLVKTHGKDSVIAAAKAAGITWTANDNPGINWMRASMAINKWMTQ